MDSNCVNNYLGHALRAKRWHGLHIHVCQKRQTGETCRSHCAQLMRRLRKDPAPQVLDMRKRFRRVMVSTETYISRCSNTLRHHSAWNKESISLPKRTHREAQGKLTLGLLPSTLSAGGREEGRNQDRKCLSFYLITVEAIDFSSLVESQGEGTMTRILDKWSGHRNFRSDTTPGTHQILQIIHTLFPSPVKGG